MPSLGAEFVTESAQPSRTILPLVTRHAEDAAFYWMQRDADAHSPLLRFDRLAHFDKLLNAHLDGLRTAGETGWELSLKNLRRWRTNGESFTAHVLMLESAQAQRLEALWQIIKDCPDTAYSGLVSALGWLDEQAALPWLEHWLSRDDHRELQAIALRAYGIRRLLPAASIEAFFTVEQASLRAAACTLAGRLRLRQYRTQLHALRQDAAPEVCATAAMALHLQGEGSAVLSNLWEAAMHWNKRAQDSKGLAQQRALEKCLTVARHLAHAIPAGHTGLEQACRQLPPRQALTMLAHHGDPATISWLLPCLERKDLARLAGWAFSMMTGVDLEEQGLTQPAPPLEKDEDERSTPLSDPDAGLPWPHPGALQAWWNAHGARYAGGTRLLLGRPMTDKQHSVEVLHEGTQGARWAAAMHLALADPEMPYVETRAPAMTQRQAIEVIGIDA